MHVFDEEIACDVGMAAAVIYQNIYFWVEKNKANDKHKYDGTYWTYNSVKAFGELFPYMTSSQIRRALKTLEEKGYIITGNYNKLAYDRTTWYALTDKGFAKLDKSICSKRQMEVDEKTNRFVPNDKPIPDINTDINTDITQDKPAPSKKFVKPKDSEIKEYAAVPKIGHTKESNINKLSKEIYDEIEKSYELSFLEVKPAGKLFIDYPRTRKRIKELLKRISKDDIIGVIEKAKADAWIKDNGFQLSTILSDFQVSKLLNGKPEGRRVYSKPLPVQTRTAFLDMED